MVTILLALQVAGGVGASAAPSLFTDTTKIIILGTGTPNPDPERSGPSVAIVVRGTAYVVDAGPGLVRRAAALAAKGQPALQASRLNHLFLTHLHSDHTVGIPDLIHTGWVHGRTGAIHAFGPPGTKAMMEHLELAFAEDIKIRRDGLQPSTKGGYRVEATEIVPGLVYEDSNVKVFAFAVPHADWKFAFGYRFVTPDRTIVVSGDTRASQAVVSACNGCDVLVHEVYSAARFKQLPAPWKRYHSAAHTGTDSLAHLALRAHPKLLVLYHQLYWGASDDDLLRELRSAGYHGKAVSARDLETY